MAAEGSLASLRSRLPRHAALLDVVADVVRRDDRWRFLEVGCSLGSGGGDELSDIDAGVGYAGVDVTDLYEAARQFARQIAVPVDFVVHRLEGWPDDVCRLAGEYDDRLQLDLVFMPADRRAGIPDRSFAIVDKDQRLTEAMTPPARLPPTAEMAHEWVVLGWWAIATADKYVRRGSLFEAVQAIDEARRHALQLWAAARRVPYAAFGLTSLLDFPPFELPDGLAATYATPADVAAVARANRATAHLLTQASVAASAVLDVDVTSPLATTVGDRITT